MKFVDVRCDMVTDGGGWIVFQRRIDATVDFYRNWNDYKNGFGDLNGNFWLGLEKIHRLASPGRGAILRIDLKHIDDPTQLTSAEYSTFEVTGESDGYRLKCSGHSGPLGDSLTYHSNRKFSTIDRDQDSNSGSCADSHKGGWWYGSCIYSNLNGRYPPNNGNNGEYMSWIAISSKYGGITFSEMKIKYSNS